MNTSEKEQLHKWEDVTDAFTEAQRHYKDTYLEVVEVYDSAVEVSLFSSVSDLYEIYVSYGKMYGIVYASPDDAHKIHKEIKADLESAYDNAKEPSSEYINRFAAKYDLRLPPDIFFS